MKKLFLCVLAAALFAACSDDDDKSYYATLKIDPVEKADQMGTTLNGSFETNGTVTLAGFYIKSEDEADWQQIVAPSIKGKVISRDFSTKVLKLNTLYSFQPFVLLAENNQEYRGPIGTVTPRSLAFIEDLDEVPSSCAVTTGPQFVKVSGVVAILIPDDQTVVGVEIADNLREDQDKTLFKDEQGDLQSRWSVVGKHLAYSFETAEISYPTGERKMDIQYIVTLERDGEIYQISASKLFEGLQIL